MSVLQLFMQHCAEYGLSYGTIEEFNFRHGLFAERHAELEALTANPAITNTVGHNFLSTWTSAERKRLLGYRRPTEVANAPTVMLEGQAAESVDWRDHNAVNVVQDQGVCGSCWTFSTCAAMEGRKAIFADGLVKLAEQEFVSCANRVNMGCNGGNVNAAFKFAETHPIVLQEEYAYTSGKFGITGDCQCDFTTSCTEGVKTKGHVNVAQQDPAQMKLAVASTVVSVAIEADQAVFQHYTGGVLTEGCGTQLDHAVAVVGYGTDATEGDYWLVRNSWAASWGDEGYIKLGITDGAGVCGVQMEPSYPLILGE